MARELKRYLEREIEEGPEGRTTPVVIPIPVPIEIQVPAADRIVPLDHNSDPYQKVLDALDELIRALRGANDYQDTDDKEQRIAEVESTKRLMQAPRIQARALAFIKSSLMYLAKKFADLTVGQIALEIIKKLAEIIGNLWSLL
jgi:hypothetical protein